MFQSVEKRILRLAMRKSALEVVCEDRIGEKTPSQVMDDGKD